MKYSNSPRSRPHRPDCSISLETYTHTLSCIRNSRFHLSSVSNLAKVLRINGFVKPINFKKDDITSRIRSIPFSQTCFSSIVNADHDVTDGFRAITPVAMEHSEVQQDLTALGWLVDGHLLDHSVQYIFGTEPEKDHFTTEMNIHDERQPDTSLQLAIVPFIESSQSPASNCPGNVKKSKATRSSPKVRKQLTERSPEKCGIVKEMNIVDVGTQKNTSLFACNLPGDSNAEISNTSRSSPKSSDLPLIVKSADHQQGQDSPPVLASSHNTALDMLQKKGLESQLLAMLGSRIISEKTDNVTSSGNDSLSTSCTSDSSTSSQAGSRNMSSSLLGRLDVRKEPLLSVPSIGSFQFTRIFPEAANAESRKTKTERNPRRANGNVIEETVSAPELKPPSLNSKPCFSGTSEDASEGFMQALKDRIMDAAAYGGKSLNLLSEWESRKQKLHLDAINEIMKSSSHGIPAAKCKKQRIETEFGDQTVGPVIKDQVSHGFRPNDKDVIKMTLAQRCRLSKEEISRLLPV